MTLQQTKFKANLSECLIAYRCTVRIGPGDTFQRHSINRNTEADLASQMPLTALITGALARALRMVLHAPAELATQCGAKFSMDVEPAGVGGSLQNFLGGFDSHNVLQF